MKFTLINIGDELLIGQVVNTLASDLARLFDPYGWSIEEILTVGDTREAITGAVTAALAKTDVVLTTGGLGPTRDDITKKVMTEIFGGELREDPATLENVLDVVARRHININPLTAAQAIVPTSARVIQNRVGTAPIMWFERDGKVLVSMPGVPFETITMTRDAVLPALLERFPSKDNIAHATTIVTGFTESNLAAYLTPFEDSLPPYLHLAYLPRPGIIRLRLDGRHPDREFIEREVAEYDRRLVSALGENVIATEDLTVPEILLKSFREKGLTFGSAESCTGGNIVHELTMVPGASDVVLGGVCSYSNEVKINLLGVKAETLEAHGAVSREVVSEMAEGARRALGADVAVATSGIAGPGGGSPEKPVGTVCIAASSARGTRAMTAHFPGSRDRVIDRATMTALLLALSLTR